MGLHAASEMWKSKDQKKVLTIVFEGGEEIVPSIKSAMNENKIKHCKIIDMEGTLREAVLDVVQGRNSKKQKFENIPIIKAAGDYKLSFDEMYGKMSVTTNEKQPRTSGFIRGTAENGLTMKLTFVE